jgi:hypothetical protein
MNCTSLKTTPAMKRRSFVKTLPAATLMAASAPGNAIPFSPSQELSPIDLLPPEKEGGATILAALQARKTERLISAKELPPQVLSNLLWAAFGVNRPEFTATKPGRTAPSASNSQEIDLYVSLPSGLYIYDALPHRLLPVAPGDHRRYASKGRATMAPVNIFYVVDLNKYDQGPEQPDTTIGDPEVQKSYYYTDTGFIAQNVYLFAASYGLAAWFHNCERDHCAEAFKLTPQQKILFAQSVGYPEF